MDYKYWIYLIAIMTGIIYVYSTFIQPAIAAYADPSMTYGFPLVMAAVITVGFVYANKMLLKKKV